MSSTDTPTKPDQKAPAGATAQEATKGLSQGRIVAKKFFGHTAAVASIVVFIIIVILAVTSQGLGPVPGWWHYSYSDTPPLVNGGAPTWQLPFAFGEHPFGQDRVGRDLFAMTMRGTQISLFIMFTIGILAGVVGIIVGSLAGYFRGWTEAILMRLTDVFIVIPTLIAAAIVGRAGGQNGVLVLGIFLGLVTWMLLGRLVRAEFLSLREREFVDAARIAGASNTRIIFKHILPNTVGVITVNLTLLMSAAILTETALSYLGLGVRAPDISLGSLISQNQAAFATRPWLFWWPGLFIVIICLCINFIGDGLRDAFDPRQKKFSLRSIKRLSAAMQLSGVSATGSFNQFALGNRAAIDEVSKDAIDEDRSLDTISRSEGDAAVEEELARQEQLIAEPGVIEPVEGSSRLYRGSPAEGGQNSRLELGDDAPGSRQRRRGDRER